MTTFETLNFTPAYNCKGIVARHTFPNGYTASVVSHEYSYGGPDGLYEIAVINSRDEIDYSTPVTSDVIGYLEPHDVTAILQQIEALPAA